jgi:AcrR family transcriptional regulator
MTMRQNARLIVRNGSGSSLDDVGERGAPRSGSRASSVRTKHRILRAAKSVLADSGYAKFTLRLVASKAGVTVGNIAYHYPSKRELVRALITLLIQDYRVQVETYLRASAKHSSNAFAALVVWLMQDSVSRQTNRLFREFWSIALRDPVIATAMDRFYEEIQETATIKLQESFPDLPLRRARAIAQLMGIVSEGSNVLYGTAQRPVAPLADVSDLASALLVHAAKQTPRRRKAVSKASKVA